MLADRPAAIAALTRIFLDEIERLLCAAAGVTRAANMPAAARSRLGAVSFLHRFGSALNHHVHLHTCVTDGVFVPAAAEVACAAPPAFLPARPVNQADLTSLTERVRRRVIRWFRLARPLDAAAAADMLAWENSGFSIDASVRITLIDRDVPSSFQSLEHLLRYCARPPFALDRASVIGGPNGRITRIRYVLPRHKAANWVGPGRGREGTGSCSAGTGACPRLQEKAGKQGQAPTAAQPEPVPRTTPRGLPGRNSWPGWARSFRSRARTVAATSG
jgi:hypothetical protein